MADCDAAARATRCRDAAHVATCVAAGRGGHRHAAARIECGGAAGIRTRHRPRGCRTAARPRERVAGASCVGGAWRIAYARRVDGGRTPSSAQHLAAAPALVHTAVGSVALALAAAFVARRVAREVRPGALAR